jgi:hypothetical protein
MTPETIEAAASALPGPLSLGDPAAEEDLRIWFQMVPELFYRLAGVGLAADTGSFVISLMASDKACCHYLCNPELMDSPSATRLARILICAEPRLDIRLAEAAREWAENAENRKPLYRCLEILEAIGAGSRISRSMVQLFACSNSDIRSKMVGLLVRSSANETDTRRWLNDADPRVRANLLESIAKITGDLEWIPKILLEHLGDPHGRAAANAAIGLYRRGSEEPALAALLRMAQDADPKMRCSSSWAMGQIPNARLLEVLHHLRTDADSRVRWSALRSLTRLNRAGVVPTRAATSGEPDPLENAA